MEKIQYLQFVTGVYETDIRVFIEGGITQTQKIEIQDKLSELIEDFNQEKGEDEEIPYYEFIEETLESLNLKYQYPKVDATIYM